MLPTTALLSPIHRPDPRFGLNPAEIFLLRMQIRGDIVAEQGEEGGNGKRLVRMTDQAVVHGVLVEEDAEPCDERVDRNHP